MEYLIKKIGDEFALENSFTKITVSLKDATVTSAVRLDTGDSYLSKEPSKFFTFFDVNNQEIELKGITLDGDVLNVASDFGTVSFKVSSFAGYFTFEVLGDISEPLEKIQFANVVCDYETEGENLWGTVGIAMTVNTNPVTLPRAKGKRARAEAERTTGNTKGAKYALISAPLALHRDILKEASETIDREKGIVLHTSGAWAKDYLPNYKNYTILHGTTKNYIERADEYKAMGIEQYDYHQGTNSFIQGNFKCEALPNMETFKREFSDVLAEKGMMTSLHTYVHYISPQCREYLSDPKWQKDFWMGEEYTLSDDIDENVTSFAVDESIAELSTNHTFFSTSLPYLLIGNEIIAFKKQDNKFVSCGRGVCGTKAVSHKKGEKVIHFLGLFNYFAPKLDSPLFLEIAHNTAKAYNEGGFGMLYLDAMDGLTRQTQKTWYYDALFTHEIVKNCKIEPIVEYADTPPSLWASMSRSGAWDHPYKGYRGFNKFHVEINRKDADDCHLLGMMGWYHFYPDVAGIPGNYTCAYQHWDDVEYLSSLCLINGYTMVMNGGVPKVMSAARRRNTDIYLKYYKLLTERYFSEDYLNKLKSLDTEYFLKNKGENKWVFEEKKFQFKRYFDYQNEKYNKESFENPFKKQTPFLRIEMGLSAEKDGRDMILLPIDESKQLPENITHSFGNNVDLRNNYALRVRIHGNGKKGSKVRISLISRSLQGGDTADYFIETDFTGWRDYIFVESHKGENPEFDKRYQHFFMVNINAIRLQEVRHIKIDSVGDIEGVRMGNIYGCKPLYDVVKNPKVKVGKTEVTFECEIKSTDFIEWDGKTAQILDRYGNARPIYFSGSLLVPKGEFKAELTSAGSLNGLLQNARLTFGFTGKEIK